MNVGGKNDGLMSDINVTPLVDVMLVLLIIFMVAAPMMIQGVNIALPEASSDPLESENEQLVVSLTKENKIFINDFEVSIDFLKEKLEKVIAGRLDREVYLKADRGIPYGMVVNVMSEIKNAGVEKLGIVTEPVETDKNQTSIPKRS
jgi:biopolymer transport protein TolR